MIASYAAETHAEHNSLCVVKKSLPADRSVTEVQQPKAFLDMDSFGDIEEEHAWNSLSLHLSGSSKTVDRHFFCNSKKKEKENQTKKKKKKTSSEGHYKVRSD